MARNALTVSARSFTDGARIPDVHARDGADRPPELDVAGVPEGTVELALVCHDPDAPRPHGFTHWVVYGLPPTTRTIDASAVAGARVGPNGWGDRAWGGPQPPVGHGVHHYFFWLYALDRPVVGAPDREAFLAGWADAVIAQARVVGTFER